MGKARRELTYYVCLPTAVHKRPIGHPASLWIAKAYLLRGISEFFSERIFGSARRSHLADMLSGSDQRALEDHRAAVVG